MSEHKLFDDIGNTVSDVQDEVAEIAQGIYGKLKFNELKPKRYNITSSKKMLQDLLSTTETFLQTLNRNKSLVGIKSVIENFVGELNKYLYLLDFCLKEDLKRRLKNQINENKIVISESELRSIIREAIKKAIM